MYHCLGQCTPKVAGYLLLTTSCLSHICTLIYCVLIRIQELKKKKKSVIFPHQWEIQHAENIGAIGISLCIFFFIKVIVTKLFKEHSQSKIKNKPNPKPRWWKVLRNFFATQKRCYHFATLSLAWPTSERMLLPGIENTLQQERACECNEHKLWELFFKLYVTLMPGLRKQMAFVSS